MKKFEPGFGIKPLYSPLGFQYEGNCFGPEIENRTLDSIRPSLLNPDCEGPEIVYSIAMDVGKIEHKELLVKMHLLFGAVIYAPGRLGEEPIRSQGHIHKASIFAEGWSTPEVYQIWTGNAIIYMQETALNDPGRCYAVFASPGDIVVVPPGWAHATISANENECLAFGAWCDREYGFEYDLVRAHRGLAWYPLLKNGKISWLHNSNYHYHKLTEKGPGNYDRLNLKQGVSIYTQFEMKPDNLNFVPKPGEKSEVWKQFVP